MDQIEYPLGLVATIGKHNLGVLAHGTAFAYTMMVLVEGWKKNHYLLEHFKCSMMKMCHTSMP
jgi:hypothetical protein